MERIDQDGLLICELQARTFELSASAVSASSEVFIRRFMNSSTVKLLDNRTVLNTILQPNDLIRMIEEQYGVSTYGSVKYSAEELYWIGYIYRYFAYTKQKSSLQVYKIIKPKELRGLYLSYHTLDPAFAIDRILEAKHLPLSEAEEQQRQLEILKKHYRELMLEKGFPDHF
jgi:hypothetical protein